MNYLKNLKRRELRKETIIIFITIIFILWILYLVVSLAFRLEDMETRALAAEARVVQLKQAVKWISILEQILPELAKDELNLLDEQLRQRKKGG